MEKSTKTGIVIFFGVILTVAMFFFSVRSNTPPSFEEIFSRGKEEIKNEEQIKTPTITIADPQKGPAEAQVTIVEFADYRCSHCAEINKTIKAIIAKYPKDVRLVWKDFPFIPPLDSTWKAHVAARCAGKQNKFWEYHDLVFDNQNNLSDSNLLEMAKNLNINTSLFETCVNNEETKPLVEKSFKEGQDIGIDGTPTFYINGNKTNSISLDLIEGLIVK